MGDPSHRWLRFGRAGFFILLQLLTSCAGLATVEEPTAAAEHFKKANAFFEEGQYAEAIKEYRYVAAQFPNDDLAADAQYQVAYTEIYFKNTGSDYGMAAKDFQKLIQKYPNSPWKNPAQNWLNFLSQLESLKTEKEKLKSDLQRLLDLDMQSEKKRRELK
ncbi:MAG: tetratricopeptide repeat protein [Nitrospirae bacterium]|nr:tetratricopeptide repeat protein [Nitrospirota bacterium]